MAGFFERIGVVDRVLISVAATSVFFGIRWFDPAVFAFPELLRDAGLILSIALAWGGVLAPRVMKFGLLLAVFLGISTQVIAGSGGQPRLIAIFPLVIGFVSLVVFWVRVKPRSAD